MEGQKHVDRVGQPLLLPQDSEWGLTLRMHIAGPQRAIVLRRVEPCGAVYFLQNQPRISGLGLSDAGSPCGRPGS
jgi:hypothetical protein